MKLLLDTHVWLWSILEPKRLRASTRERLVDRQSRLYLSPISVWEAVMAIERQRVEVPGDPVRWIDMALELTPVLEAGLTFDVARLSRRLRLDHQDPADRFIAATARVFRLTLVTADRKLLDASELETLAA